MTEYTNIDFPYKKYYIKPLKELFKNLKNYDTTLIYDQPYKLKNIIDVTGKYFDLFNIKYNDRYIFIPNLSDNYENINVIADYFTEDARVKSIGFMQKISPYDCWHDDICKKKIINHCIKNYSIINIQNLRESLYENITEARQGTPTSYLSLYTFFNAKNVLDGASAWGDRMISAIACKNVKTYVGVDPNKLLFKGYSKIIKRLMKTKQNYILKNENYDKIIKTMKENNISKAYCTIKKNNVVKKLETFGTNKKIIMIKSAFEKSVLPKNIKYDLCILSPAPFEGEIYSDPDGQSRTNYDNFNEWFTNYMLATIIKMYENLVDGGNIIITILDRPNIDYKIVELLNLCISYICKHLFYKGVIGWQGSTQKITPWFVWNKNDNEKYEKKIESAKFYLKKYYPNIFKLII